MNAHERGALANAAARDVQRPWTTDQIFEQVERDGMTHGEVVDGFALDDVRAVKKHVAVISHVDIPVALPDEELGDPSPQ
jgi:hypothetical protein